MYLLWTKIQNFRFIKSSHDKIWNTCTNLIYWHTIIIGINMFKRGRKKMSDTFEKHIDRRISKMRKMTRISRLKKKIETRTSGQRVEKAWKNINEIKPN